MTNYGFGDYVLRADTHQLLFRGEEVHLSPKAFELLRVLLANYPRAVSKNELRDRLWPGVFVADGNLAFLVTEIRRVLRDDSHRPRFIRTVHAFGYAFMADVVVGPAKSLEASAPAADQASYWLLWRSRALQLPAGTNIVGREPGVDVAIDFPGVSRRHARITIDNGAVSIEDLGSKNGTYVGNVPVNARVELRDGDRVQLGPAVMVFRISSHASDAETLTCRARQPAS